jgi:hypothetical protein
MRSMRFSVLAAVAAVLALVSAGFAQRAASPHGVRPDRVDVRPAHPTGLARGVNFGNMLEAPFEGAWGLTVEEEFFDLVVEAGMDHIRLPVSWTHHAQAAPPYTIDPEFMDRVAWCVDQAAARAGSDHRQHAPLRRTERGPGRGTPGAGDLAAGRRRASRTDRTGSDAVLLRGAQRAARGVQRRSRALGRLPRRRRSA